MNQLRSTKFEWLDSSTTTMIITNARIMVMIMARMLPIMITTIMAISHQQPALAATT